MEKRLLPSYVWTSDPLMFWRERILFLICFIAAVFGPIALVPSLLLSYREGLWIVILVDSLAYMAVVTILIARNASFAVRAMVLCFILYALGVSILFILGPGGAGYIWLFGASVLISTFIGLGAAIWTLVLNTIALLSVGVFIAYGNPEWILHVDNALEKWLVMAANFLLLNAFVTITTAFMLNGLVKALLKEQKISNSLRESEDKFRTIFDKASDGMLIADAITKKFLQGNAAICSMLGYTKEEIESLTINDINPPNDISHVLDEFKKQGKGEKAFAEDLQLLRKDGSIFYADIGSFPVIIGGVPCLVGIFRDITERKQADAEKMKLQTQLIQAQKMEAIGTLAGGIAHDFNNILTAVIGYTELAQMNFEAGSEIKEDLKEVLAASVRAKDLVDQILSFSRQTQKEQVPVQMRLIVKEALKLIRSSLPVTIDIRQSILSQSLVLSDPTQLHQIVMNLCTNAAHAMREKGGILEVVLTDVELDSAFCSTHAEIQPGTYQKLTVSDTGHGISADVMNQIFDPFFTTKPKNEGTGLGLSVVHGIVKDSGGTITVYSEPDLGTTFNLYFPIIKGRAEEKPEEHTILPTGTERILVVDDEKVITDILNKTLSNLGYTVEARTSSLETLALFKAMPDKFDLVITDMTMPQMTGDKLALELLKIRPDLPVILCTGFSQNITKEKAKTMGIKAFLMKPLLIKEMAHTIRKVLDKAKESTQAKR